MFGFDPVDRELRNIELAGLRRARHDERVAQADPGLAQRVSSLASDYPWMKPGVVWSLGKAGHHPATPLAQELARRAAVVASRRSFAATGEPVKTGTLKGKADPMAVRRLGQRDVLAQREAAFDVGGQRERFKEARGYFPEDEGAAFAKATELQARLAIKYPDADDEIIWQMARLGIEPGTPTANEVAKGNRRLPDPEAARTLRQLAEIQQRPSGAAPDEAELERLQRSGAGFLAEQNPDTAGFGTLPLVAAARGAGMVLNAPGQELQGLFRNVVSDIERLVGGDTTLDVGKFTEAQSDLGIAGEQLAAGQPLDTGHGFFVDPESELAKERLRRELERGTIGGHVITVGRWVGSGLGLDPDTRAFNIVSGLLDAGVAVKADPSALVLSKAGAVRGLRSVVQPEKIDAWLAGPGRKVVDHLAGEKNWDRMWRLLEKKAPADLVSRLTDADTSDEVTAILREELGPGLRNFPTLPAATKPGFTKKGYVRLAQLIPAKRADLNDIDDAVEQVDRLAKTYKIPADRVAEYTERMGRAAGDRYEQRDVLFSLMDEAQTYVKVDPDRAKKFTRLYVEGYDDTRKFNTDALGNNVDFPGAMIDEVGGIKPSPHLYDEVMGRFVELPDAREVRRATSRFPNLMTSKAWELPVAAADFIVGSVWKTTVLFRAAYAVRVIGEEQFRMAGAGLESMFRHPMSYWSYVLGRKGGVDALDNSWADIEQFQRAMTRGSAGWKDPSGFHRSRHWMNVSPGDDHYVASWADELSQVAADPIAPRTITDDPDAVLDWFMTGSGAHLRNDLLRVEEFAPLRTREGARKYLDSVRERVMVKTSGDSRLLDAVTTKRLNGAPLTHDGYLMSRDFVKELKAIHDEGLDVGKVKGRIPMQRDARDHGGQLVEAWDRATEWIFAHLMSIPTNKLSRSRAFEQFYWARMQELAPWLDGASYDRLVRQAAKAKVSLSTRFESAAERTINLDEADLLAKGHALDEAKHLLYDLSERGQAEDALRLIFPFGGAYKEMVTRWFVGRDALLNPLSPHGAKNARRLQQGIEEGKESGFFYYDPVALARGEKRLVFNYPGSAWFNDVVAGVPVPLTGRVEGLSLMTEVLPGFGPVVQVPATYFSEKFFEDSKWDRLRDIVLPFGPAKGFVELPIWMQRFLAPVGFGSADQQRAYASTYMDVATYLISTGRYDVHGENAADEMDRVMRDARKAARKLYWVRAVGQASLPAAPSPQWVVEDKQGNLALLGVMRNDWYRMVEDAGGDTDKAVAQFIDTYGEDVFGVMQGKTFAVVFGIPSTTEADRWVRDHPGIRKRYPFSFGYFAPQEGELNLDAVRRSAEEGSREQLTPEQWMQLANHRVASFMYRKEAEAFGTRPTDEQRLWLGELKSFLRERYPGYDSAIFGLPQRAENEDVIRELQKAAEDPDLSDTPTGKGLREYFVERADMAEVSKARGYSPSSFATAQANRDLRDYLREMGEFLSEEYPDFRGVWEGVLNRELNEDIKDVQVAS